MIVEVSPCFTSRPGCSASLCTLLAVIGNAALHPSSSTSRLLQLQFAHHRVSESLIENANRLHLFIPALWRDYLRPTRGPQATTDTIMPEATDHFQGRHYAAEHTTRPFSALNPTKRYIAVDKPESGSGAAAQKHPGAVYVWRSRDNRKGRHGVAIDPEHRDENHVAGQRLSESWLQTSRGLAKMVLDYPIWDVSYDVAVVFSIGK